MVGVGEISNVVEDTAKSDRGHTPVAGSLHIGTTSIADVNRADGSSQPSSASTQSNICGAGLYDPMTSLNASRSNASRSRRSRIQSMRTPDGVSPMSHTIAVREPSRRICSISSATPATIVISARALPTANPESITRAAAGSRPSSIRMISDRVVGAELFIGEPTPPRSELVPRRVRRRSSSSETSTPIATAPNASPERDRRRERPGTTRR